MHNKRLQKIDKTILMTGLSGSGKTTLSDKMANELGYNIIHVDEYVRKIFKQNYPYHSMFELEKELGINKLRRLINKYQYIIFSELFNEYNGSKTILEATVIMDKMVYPIIDNNLDIDIYLIKLLSESEIYKRRIERSIEKRRKKGLPLFNSEELKQKRKSSKLLYQEKKKLYDAFYIKYKKRLKLIEN